MFVTFDNTTFSGNPIPKRGSLAPALPADTGSQSLLTKKIDRTLRYWDAIDGA